MMINDTNKKSKGRRRNTAILLGACVFAFALSAVAQLSSGTQTPLTGKQQMSESLPTPATVPQAVEKTTDSVAWTPDEFASLADEMFEQESRKADSAFEGAAADPTQSVAVDGVPADAAPADASPDAAAQARTVFTLPAGTDIAKDYSMGVPVFSDTMEDWRTHNGVDFAGNEGDPVVSAADGVVKAVYEDVAWGCVAELDFGNSITAKYCGLSPDSVTVAVGDSVEKGAVIGVLGSIPVEEKDGCHLHYEMRVDGIVADPLEVMGRGGAED